jgi:hypothetical protein
LLFIFFEANSPRPDGNVELDAGEQLRDATEQLRDATKKAFSSFLLPNHVLFAQVNSEV